MRFVFVLLVWAACSACVLGALMSQGFQPVAVPVKVPGVLGKNGGYVLAALIILATLLNNQSNTIGTPIERLYMDSNGNMVPVPPSS